MPSARPHHHEERLRIRAFGPIAEADITVRPLTVFIGPQATGKSLTAQLLYFMRGLEELVEPEPAMPGSMVLPEADLTDRLGKWIDRSLLNLAISPRSQVSWSALSTSPSDQEVQECTLSGIERPGFGSEVQLHGNEALRLRINQALTNPAPPSLIAEEQTYVPAGRILCSLVPPWLGLSLLSRQRLPWPGYLSMFYEKLGKAISLLPTDPAQASLFRSPAQERLTEKSRSSLRGHLSRRQRDVQLSVQLREYKEVVVNSAIGGGFASGQLETWPLWTLLQAHLPSDQIKRIFIEEPEAHLHPTAQRDTVEALVTLLRHRFRFVLTTHSPYVLYALNNALLAGRVLRDGKQLPKDFPADFSLAPQDISAYRFTHDGQVVSLFDEETGLLDAAELDDPAAALSAEFSDLQDAFYRDKP
jgi:hypothetical protein